MLQGRAPIRPYVTSARPRIQVATDFWGGKAIRACGEWVRAMSDQSDSDFASSNKIEKAGQAFCSRCKRRLMWLKQVGRPREGSRISFKMPKIGLHSSKIGLES
jgi:hypothetical protein